ncbi:DegT/DnrJ/EryC1/StrS family aminotransferase [Marinilabiliaceae bacterium JC017]|nr:DegT/DnrJ/EryC1/StrS family aminotransferase [Marinilabiliaceae bacterium JC017]
MLEEQMIQMVDLKAQYKRLKSEIDAAMMNVMESSNFINGPAVKTFQSNLEQYLNVRHVVPCANGTDALQVALMALGLKPGDEVITSSFTFIATVEVIGLLQLKPVLVDVDTETMTLIPEEVKKAITPKTKVVIPVHLFGQGANMEAIMHLAKKYGLYVVEDACQCLGAGFGTKRKKQKLGTIGHIGCTSFFPSKNLGAFGDGGACFTNDDLLADRIRMLVNHGSREKYFHEVIGVNSRLDSLQAAILDVKLKHLDDFNKRRQAAATYYDDVFKNIDEVAIPVIQGGSEHIYHQYTLRVLNGRRDDMFIFLKKQGIPAMIYYPQPLHKQKAFSAWIENDLKLPNAERLSNEVISLPMHTELTEEQLDYISTAVLSCFMA